MAPEACPAADGEAGSWGTWADGDSPAAGAASVDWDLQDAEAAGAGFIVHLPVVVQFELASPWLVHQLVLECHKECVLERW